LTVAAIEAFRVVGFQKIKADLIVLYEAFLSTRKALAEQDACKKGAPIEGTAIKRRKYQEEPEEENQGSQFVQKITSTLTENENFMKIRRVLGSIDPNIVTQSLSSLGAGIVAVVATLQSQFVQALTLGCSVGDMILTPFRDYITKKAQEKLPEDINRWTEPALKYASRGIGVMIALMLRQTILTFNLCSKSAELILYGLQEKKLIPKNASFAGTAVFAIAGIGFMKQILFGASLPLLLWIPAIPILIIELIVSTISVMKVF